MEVEFYEFYGCYYHGCPQCFPDRSKVVHHKHCENGYRSIEQAYRDMVACENEIKFELDFSNGFDKYIVIWEHENKEMFKNYLGKGMMYIPVDKLIPRDSVNGGHTEVLRMHCEV